MRTLQVLRVVANWVTMQNLSGGSGHARRAAQVLGEKLPLLQLAVRDLERILPLVNDTEDEYTELLKTLRGLICLAYSGDMVKTNCTCYVEGLIRCFRGMYIKVLLLGKQRLEHDEAPVKPHLYSALYDVAGDLVKACMRLWEIQLRPCETGDWGGSGGDKGMRFSGAEEGTIGKLPADPRAIFVLEDVANLTNTLLRVMVEVVVHLKRYVVTTDPCDSSLASMWRSKEPQIRVRAQNLKSAALSARSSCLEFESCMSKAVGSVHKLLRLMDAYFSLHFKMMSLQLQLDSMRGLLAFT
jgi:hypothetical protein